MFYASFLCGTTCYFVLVRAIIYLMKNRKIVREDCYV